MKLKSSQMPSSSSQSPSKETSNVVITPDAMNYTSTSQKSSDESNQNRYDATYRKHMRGMLDDIVMEYINNDTDVTPYDFISDLKTSLYEIQDYYQNQMNRVNAILAYLNGEQSPHLFDLKSKEKCGNSDIG